MISKKKLESRYVGKQFGKLYVTSHEDNRKSLNYWNCRCKCGNECIKSSSYLKSHELVNCGHCTTYRKFRGIYTITNKINGKYYLGSSVNINSRWHDHRKYLRGGYHHSIALQRAWDKYGEENFEFKILRELPEDIDLLEVEQYYLDEWKCHYNSSRVASTGGYNLCKPVVQYSLEGERLNEFESIKDAERCTGTNETSIIHCCKKKIRKNGSPWKSAGGYLWSYKGEKPMKYYSRDYSSHEKQLNQYDLNSKLVATFKSVAEAARELNISKDGLYRILRKNKFNQFAGSLWAYEGDPIPEMKKFKRVQKVCRNTGDILEEYDNCEIAAKSVGVSNGNNINAVIHGKRKSCAGYSWCYSEVK